MQNPFFADRIKSAAADASLPSLFQFAISSATRSVGCGAEVLGGVVEADQATLLGALNASWRVFGGSEEPLAVHISTLAGRLVPDWDGRYTFYNSVVNDALTSMLHAVKVVVEPLPRQSAYRASETFFNMVDLVMHRHRAEYVADIASEPAIVAALEYLESDLCRLQSGKTQPDAGSFRDQLMAEGRQVAMLG